MNEFESDGSWIFHQISLTIGRKSVKLVHQLDFLNELTALQHLPDTRYAFLNIPPKSLSLSAEEQLGWLKESQFADWSEEVRVWFFRTFCFCFLAYSVVCSYAVLSAALNLILMCFQCVTIVFQVFVVRFNSSSNLAVVTVFSNVSGQTAERATADGDPVCGLEQRGRDHDHGRTTEEESGIETCYGLGEGGGSYHVC